MKRLVAGFILVVVFIILMATSDGGPAVQQENITEPDVLSAFMREVDFNV